MKVLDWFLSSLSLLTIFPISKKGDLNYKIIIFFPFVGFILGSLCYFVFAVLEKFLSHKLATLFVFIFYIFICDFFHLDGFVDTVDALACFKKDKIQVLKDPHIGAVGAVYLVLVIIAKYVLLTEVENLKVCMIIMPIYSKTSLAIVGYFGKELSHYGLGRNFLYRDLKILALSIIFCAGLCFLIFRHIGLVLFFILLNFLSSFLLSKYFNYKLGGFNGDIFGFVNEISEISFLLVFILTTNRIF